MLGDASEDIGEPGLRVDIVEPRGLNECVEDRGTLAAAIGTTEQPGLAAERDAAKSSLGGVVGQADAPIFEEARERVPVPEHVETSLGEIVVARELCELGRQPLVQLGHQRCAEFLARGEALSRILTIDGALDVEQGIDPLHRLECDRIDHRGSRSPALLAGGAHDIGQFEELAPRMSEAAGFAHRRRLASLAIELAVTAIGVGLQDP